MFKQVFRFVIVGGIATLIDMGGLYLLYYGFGVHYQVAAVISFVLSVLFNYWASMRYVFDSKYGQDEKQKEFVVFVGLNLAGLLVNLGVLTIFVEWVGISVFWAKIVTGVFTMIFNFVTRKLFLEDRS